MGPTCKSMNLCCENGHFDMGSMDICSLLGPAPSGFSMYFQVGFIFQIRMLLLGWDMFSEVKEGFDKVLHVSVGVCLYLLIHLHCV